MLNPYFIGLYDTSFIFDLNFFDKGPFSFSSLVQPNMLHVSSFPLLILASLYIPFSPHYTKFFISFIFVVQEVILVFFFCELIYLPKSYLFIVILFNIIFHSNTDFSSAKAFWISWFQNKFPYESCSSPPWTSQVFLHQPV